MTVFTMGDLIGQPDHGNEHPVGSAGFPDSLSVLLPVHLPLPVFCRLLGDPAETQCILNALVSFPHRIGFEPLDRLQHFVRHSIHQ